MPDDKPKRPPTLQDTPRPPKSPAAERWMADADKIRKAHEAGLNVDVLPGGGILISDADGPVKS